MLHFGLLKCSCTRHFQLQQCVSVIKFLNYATFQLRPKCARFSFHCSHFFSSQMHYTKKSTSISSTSYEKYNANSGSIPTTNSWLLARDNIHISRFYSNRDSEWENLLSSEKRNNIKDIPVKRENIYTIPNLLCCLRIGLAPYIGYLITHQDFAIALIFSLFAAFSDVADGYIARRWPSQQSALGSALDPLADKILVSVLAVSLSYVNIFPVVLTALFVGRDALLIGSVFYLRYKTCPPPLTLKRYFDPTLVNAKLSPTKISKVNTALQITVIWASVASPVFGFTDHILLKALWCASAATTIASGLSYIQRNDTVRILKDNDTSK